ncbi:hypothetical protein Q9189_006784 [Teloschistes chrysophthalmus]
MSSQQTDDFSLRHDMASQALADIERQLSHEQTLLLRGVPCSPAAEARLKQLEARNNHVGRELNQVRYHIEQRIYSMPGPVAPPPPTTTLASRPVQHLPRPVQQAAAASSSSSSSSMQNPYPNNNIQRTQPSQQLRVQNMQGTTGSSMNGDPGATAQVNAVQAQRPQHPWRADKGEEPWGAGPWRPNGNNP